MENKKQTAVEWLIDKIQDQRENGNNDLRTTLYYCEQANEMFEEQLKDAYNQGYRDGEHDTSNIPLSIGDISEYINAEQYYNKTFKSE